MSQLVRRKHVLKEMMQDDYELPSPGQEIVKVVRSCGNNLHEVEKPEPESTKYLVSMPTKFRRNIWIKRGDYLLVDPIVEGCKVKGEICKILTPDHIIEFSKAGVWPESFKSAVQKYTRNTWQKVNGEKDECTEYNQNYLLVQPNCNRYVVERSHSNTDDDDSEDDEGEEDSDDEDDESTTEETESVEDGEDEKDKEDEVN